MIEDKAKELGRLIGQSPFVVLSDPDELKQLFQAPPDVLHPGEGARILEPVVGANSVILLDEGPHLRQRKLLLPAFHGESMQRLASLMADLAEDEVSGWPQGEAFASHPRLQRVTLEIILRTVFGLERGAQLESLRERLRELLTFGEGLHWAIRRRLPANAVIYLSADSKALARPNIQF